MATGFTFLPFQITVGKEFPGIVVIAFSFITDSGFKTIPVKQSDSYADSAILLSGKSGRRHTDYSNYCDK